MNHAQAIKAHVLALPEVADWPEMVDICERATQRQIQSWNWPMPACQAVGGEVEAAIPGAAAMDCMYISIILVDDMLDDDPRGEHLRIGCGPAANLALAFQAAAFRIVERAQVSVERRAALVASLAWMAHATALGQHMDVQNLEGEASYWRVVRAKSTPYYATAFHVGALLGNATSEVAAGLRNLGLLIGEIGQIHDDLLDAFQTPASPDWTQGRLNLPILYARTADHPDRGRFLEALSRIKHPGALRDAQQILIRCGAVSYCVYQLVERHREARQLLADIALKDPRPMADLLAQQARPLVKLLERSDVPVPTELRELAE